MRQLLRINEEKQFFEISAWIGQAWQDSTLKWDKHRYNGINRIKVKPDGIWRPDIFVYNYIDDGSADHGGRLNKFNSEAFVYRWSSNKSGYRYAFVPKIDIMNLLIIHDLVNFS